MSIDRKTEHSALELSTNIPRFRVVNLNTPVQRMDGFAPSDRIELFCAYSAVIQRTQNIY
jgi:hypothetical protein